LFDDFVEQITIFSKKNNGNSSSVRYSTRLLRLALSLSNKPTSYRIVNGHTSLPSWRQIQKYKAGEKHKGGKCITPYLKIIESLQNKEPIMGQLIQDGFKLVNGLTWDKSGNIVAFEEITSFDVLKYSTYNDKKLISNVSQWSFRLINSRDQYILNHFFHAKEPTGETLISEFLYNTRNLTTILLYVVCIVMDAGGGNSKFFRSLLYGSKKVPNDIWLKDEDVFFNHPFLENVKISCNFCFVHSLKAHRNALLSDKRHLMINDQKITWEVIVWLFEIDSNILRNGGVGNSELTRNMVNPDSFNKMNVENCKRVFSERTICAGILLCETLLNLIIPDEFMTLSLIEKIDYLSTFEWISDQLNPLPTLRYMCYINILYNQFAINSELFVTYENYEEKYNMCKKIFVNYFGEWKKHTYYKNFLSSQTFFNMRLGFAGFFYLCKSQIDRDINSRISISKGNQSATELLFCIMRGENKDQEVTPENYNNTIGTMATNCCNILADPNILKHSNTYNPDHVNGDENRIISNKSLVKNKTIQNVNSIRNKAIEPLKEVLKQNFDLINSLKPPGNTSTELIFSTIYIYIYLIIVYISFTLFQFILFTC